MLGNISQYPCSEIYKAGLDVVIVCRILDFILSWQSQSDI